MEKGLKVIIIDDDKDYLFTMETFLKRNDFNVQTAENGKDGIDLVKKEKPDFILLDVMMETLYSGYEVCKAIRSDPELEFTPIIGISGMGEDLGVQYQQSRDDQYFTPDVFVEKPVDKQNLLSVIEEAIQKAKKRKKRPNWKKSLDDKYGDKMY